VSPLQVVLTAIITVPILVGIVFAGILCMVVENAVGGWVIIVGAAVIVNWWAFAWRKSARWRGVSMGLWIGFGVAALIEGACFGIMRS
jgi:hypothetical protein